MDFYSAFRCWGCRPLLLGLWVLGGCAGDPEGGACSFDEDAVCFCSENPNALECRDPEDNRVDVCLRISAMTIAPVVAWSADRQRAMDYWDPESARLRKSRLEAYFGHGEMRSRDPLESGACAVWWDLTGITTAASTASGSALEPGLRFSGLNLADGESNCGRDSQPGAADAVELCGDWFGGDPVEVMSAANWSFGFGGQVAEPRVEFQEAIGEPYDDTYWGAELDTDLISDRLPPTDYVARGWVVDAQMEPVTSGTGEPVQHTETSWLVDEVAQSGVYWWVQDVVFLLPEGGLATAQ